ncbi:hypothetical protein [Streptomyces phaeofaciens]|uniref:hypothetical protein n=1 Tax=Streptomyces phaeofaciens TaxID=68254 RepID=UPI0036B8BD7B
MVQLVLALQELINEAGTTLDAIAKETPGLTNRQALSRNLRRASGPDEHVVTAVVRHCARVLGRPADSQLSRFRALWSDARALPVPDPGAGQPSAVAPVDPELVAPALLLISEGHRHAAANLLAATYPTGSEALGQILAEVGRRTPGGVADLLDAATEQSGSATRNVFHDALQKADAAVAAAVEAVPRTGADPIEPPEEAHRESRTMPGVMQRTPEEIEGQRRARQVRTGHVAQVVAEIIAEATPEPGPADKSARSWRAFGGQPDVDPQSALDTDRAWQLIVDVCHQDPDDDVILASILTQAIAVRHPDLALQALRAIHDASTDEGPGYVRQIQKQMKRPELLAALDHLAEGRARVAPDTLLLLLAQAPPRVTAGFLLKHRLSALRPSLDLCDLPRLDTILRSMTEVDSPATALVLARQIMSWNHGLALKDGGPEKRFALAFLDLARADPDGTGRLFHALFGQSPAEASQLVGILEASGPDSPVVASAAHALGRALQQDSVIAGFIARAAQDHAMTYRLLDRVAQSSATHATLLITAMLSADLPRFQHLLPDMIRQNAFALALEMLRQLNLRDPQGPWQDAAQALTGNDVDAALAQLDFHLIFKRLRQD